MLRKCPLDQTHNHNIRVLDQNDLCIWTHRALKWALKSFDRAVIWPTQDLPAALDAALDVLDICAVRVMTDLKEETLYDISAWLDGRNCTCDDGSDPECTARVFVHALQPLLKATAQTMPSKRLRRSRIQLEQVLQFALTAFIARDLDLHAEVLAERFRQLLDAFCAYESEAARAIIRELHIQLRPEALADGSATLFGQDEPSTTARTTVAGPVNGAFGSAAHTASCEAAIARVEARLRSLDPTLPDDANAVRWLTARLLNMRQGLVADQRCAEADSEAFE